MDAPPTAARHPTMQGLAANKKESPKQTCQPKTAFLFYGGSEVRNFHPNTSIPDRVERERETFP